MANADVIAMMERNRRNLKEMIVEIERHDRDNEQNKVYENGKGGDRIDRRIVEI